MDREINQATFENLLFALDEDRDAAGAKYVELRENLTKFFTWRGIGEAETYADETLNRAARRLGESENVENFRSYIFGIARMMCLEINRRDIKTRRALEELPRQTIAGTQEKLRREIEFDCLGNCLQTFSPADKTFVLAYYQGERGAKIENRKKLQTQSNLSASGFRMKALRLREKLETCVKSCCSEKSEKQL